jgi:hypothetical protein
MLIYILEGYVSCPWAEVAVEAELATHSVSVAMVVLLRLDAPELRSSVPAVRVSGLLMFFIFCE